jgi:hypothetical protein
LDEFNESLVRRTINDYIVEKQRLTLREVHQKVEKNSVRFEVLTAVTMKNDVFWDIKTQFVPHRRHYVSATEPSQLKLCKI